MTKEEAASLSQAIRDTQQKYQVTGEIKSLSSSDDFVVVLSNGIFLWSKEEWKQFKKGVLEALTIQNITDDIEIETS